MRMCSLVCLFSLLLAFPSVHASELAGRVVTGAGKPVPGAKVITTSYLPDATPNDPVPPVELRSAVADAAGKFVIRGVRDMAGEESTCHNAVVVAPGYALGGVHWHGEMKAKKQPQVRIRLAPAAAWRAVVVDPKGKPVPNCPVRIEEMVLNFTGKPMPRTETRYGRSFDGPATSFEGISLGKEFGALTVRRTNARGEVAFTAAPRDGLVNATVTFGDYARRHDERLRVDAARPAKLALQPGATLTGRAVVAATGEPRAGLWVWITDMRRFNDQATTGARGEFTLRNIPAGTYLLAGVFPPGYDLTASQLQNIVVAAGANAQAPDLKLVEGGIVSGTVTDAESGKPVVGAQVYHASSTFSQSAKTDGEGRFRLRLLPGAASLQAYDSGRSDQRSVQVEEGKSVAVDLKLSSGGRRVPTVFPELTLKPGTYAMKWVDGNEGHSFYSGSRMLSWQAARPDALKGEPPLPQGAARRYALLPLGEPVKTFVVILQESKAGKGVDTLYADTDGDGDLTRERQVTPTEDRAYTSGKETYRYLQFPAIAFQCPTGESTRTVSVAIQGSQRRSQPMGDLHFRLRGYWAGEIETDKGKMRVALSDSVGMARFEPGGPAMLCMDLALSGEPEFGYYPGARQPLGKAQLISGKLYRITPSRVGDQLQVEAYDGPVATLKVAAVGGRGQQAKAADVWVSGSAGAFSVQGGQEVSLPPGSYTLGAARVICEEGARRAEIQVQSNQPIALDVGKPQVVTLGGPIRIALQASRVTPTGKGKAPKAGPPSGDYAGLPMLFPRGKETKVKLNLTADGGAGVKPDSDAQRRKAFTAALLDLKGKKLLDASIEYG